LPHPPFIQATAQGWHLLVKVQPGAKKTELAGQTEGMLRVRLAAPPVDNKANAALLEFMAAQIKVRKNKIRLAAGDKSRQKRLFIPSEAKPDFSALAAQAGNEIGEQAK
jgi:uncharacterized protein (TIGR00251 family)